MVQESLGPRRGASAVTQRPVDATRFAGSLVSLPSGGGVRCNVYGAHGYTCEEKSASPSPSLITSSSVKTRLGGHTNGDGLGQRRMMVLGNGGKATERPIGQMTVTPGRNQPYTRQNLLDISAGNTAR